jgi:putative ABC transport system permease protein
MFTLLNVFGLALGLAVSLILFLHVYHELSFDQYHNKVDRIYRVNLNAFWDPEKPEQLANVPNAVAPAMKANIAAVEQSARVLKHEFGESAFVSVGNEKFVEKSLYWVDPDFFDIFDVPVLFGDLKAAMNQPNTIALSRATAMLYFGATNVVGKSLQIDQMPTLEIKAVFEDFPENSSFDAHILGSFQTIQWANQKLVWSNSSFETWVLLGPNSPKNQVETQLLALLDQNVPKEEQSFSFWLQPLSEVHLHSSNLRYSYSANPGDPKQVSILGALALAILLIACFNYMNLSTARSQLRFKEVGINKSLGASRSQLALRFYIETGVLTCLAMLLATLLLAIGIPYFNVLADKKLDVGMLYQPVSLLAILGFSALVAFIAGSYPAFLLSGFSPKNLLNTSFRKSSGAGWLRRSLVTAQFTASVVLIISTIILHKQMQFIQQKKLGFEPEQVVAITTVAAETKEQLDVLIQGCKQLSGVQAVCRAQSFPGAKTSLRSVHRTPEDSEGAPLKSNRVGSGVEQTLGLKLIAGVAIPEKNPDDTLVNVVINQTTLHYLGYSPEDAIGKQIDCDLGPNSYIRGVVEDFHSESLHKTMVAYAFHDAPTETRRFLLVKMNTNNLPETMSQLKTVFTKALPHSAFEYVFLDDHLDKLYRSEERTANTVFVFSLLSVLICCLGLFGLATFAAEQRKKEIGIRKVLGGSMSSNVGLLSRDFLKLVLAAIVIAIPIASFFMNRWLEDFAYHIEIQWWMFLIAGILATTVAFFTVALLGLRAALANPVDSLRNE